MKNAILLLAACAFTTASFAQTPQTEVHTRNNGTKKIVTTNGDKKTVSRTGKTNVGAAITNTADATGNLFKKGAKKVKHGTQKGSKKLRNSTEKMEKKSE